MKFIALVSGGKDSIFTICKLVDNGHELVGILHMRSIHEYSDSYMYQTVGTEAIHNIAKCLGTKLYLGHTDCKSINKQLVYEEAVDDEVEDLYRALEDARADLHFEAVSSGAILSTYQKNRVENVCRRLNVQSLAPLWKMDQKKLLEEMIESRMDARVIKIASGCFTKEMLNKDLRFLYDHFNSDVLETNYCGEGGEYETLVLDCPVYKNKIVITESQVMPHPDNDGVVYYLKINKMSLANKLP